MSWFRFTALFVTNLIGAGCGDNLSTLTGRLSRLVVLEDSTEITTQEFDGLFVSISDSEGRQRYLLDSEGEFSSPSYDPPYLATFEGVGTFADTSYFLDAKLVHQGRIDAERALDDDESLLEVHGSNLAPWTSGAQLLLYSPGARCVRSLISGPVVEDATEIHQFVPNSGACLVRSDKGDRVFVVQRLPKGKRQQILARFAEVSLVQNAGVSASLEFEFEDTAGGPMTMRPEFELFEAEAEHATNARSFLFSRSSVVASPFVWELGGKAEMLVLNEQVDTEGSNVDHTFSATTPEGFPERWMHVAHAIETQSLPYEPDDFNGVGISARIITVGPFLDDVTLAPVARVVRSVRIDDFSADQRGHSNAAPTVSWECDDCASSMRFVLEVLRLYQENGLWKYERVHWISVSPDLRSVALPRDILQSGDSYSIRIANEAYDGGFFGSAEYLSARFDVR